MFKILDKLFNTESFRNRSSMPKLYKEKWLTALRSGEYVTTNGVTSWVPTYKQARGSLKNDNGYCCLGVLQHCLTGSVEMYGHTDVSCNLPSYSWLKSHGINFIEDNSKAQTPALKCATLDDANKRHYSASSLNDTYDFTFNQIADLIEAQVEGI